MRVLTRQELEEVILGVGFPEITSTIRKQILTGVQKYNLTYLEIGYIVQYAFIEMNKPVRVNPAYGIGLAYNVKTQALDYAKTRLEQKAKQKELYAIAQKKEQDGKRVIKVVSKPRQYHPREIDINKL